MDAVDGETHGQNTDSLGQFIHLALVSRFWSRSIPSFTTNIGITIQLPIVTAIMRNAIGSPPRLVRLPSYQCATVRPQAKFVASQMRTTQAPYHIHAPPRITRTNSGTLDEIRMRAPGFCCTLKGVCQSHGATSIIIEIFHSRNAAFADRIVNPMHLSKSLEINRTPPSVSPSPLALENQRGFCGAQLSCPFHEEYQLTFWRHILADLRENG